MVAPLSVFVFAPVLALSSPGPTLLLAGALLAAALGTFAFGWAVILIWRENNPQSIAMRTHRTHRAGSSETGQPSNDGASETVRDSVKT
jgi:hypothetical protein